MIYFVSGHRDITREEFETYYIPKLEEAICTDSAEFVVGDYEGVDKMAMDYLASHSCCLTIYHMFDSPRNIPTYTPLSVYITYRGGFKTDEERDSAMTLVSDIDIAFIRKNKWDSGTAQNIKRRHTIC